MHGSPFRFRASVAFRAKASVGLFLFLVGMPAIHAADTPTVSHVRFQLRTDCTCASCCFELQDRLHKVPGVGRIDISSRDKTVAVALDESRSPVGMVAAAIDSSVLGKNSSLIGNLSPGAPAALPAAVTQVEGIKSAEVDSKKGRLLLRLIPGGHTTLSELTAALARANVAVHFDNTDKK